MSSDGLTPARRALIERKVLRGDLQQDDCMNRCLLELDHARTARTAKWLRAAICAAAGGLLLYTTAAAQSRGELLYSTHCIECHSTQMHWRDKKLATDWDTLREQVRRWQAVASLDWRDEDILDVTRHLNERYYHFPSSRPVGSVPPARALAENGR